MEVLFPIYLEIMNGKSIYEITSETEMLETQIIGEKYIQHKMRAKIYPEKVLIADMIANEGQRWLRLSRDEYQLKLEAIRSLKSLLS